MHTAQFLISQSSFELVFFPNMYQLTYLSENNQQPKDYGGDIFVRLLFSNI